MTAGKGIDLDAVRASGKPFIWSFTTVSTDDSYWFANLVAEKLSQDRQCGAVILQVRPRMTTIIFEKDESKAMAEVMIR